MTRPDGRANDELRPVAWELDFQEWAKGSVLFSMGKTRVLVAASVEEEAPRWLRGTGQGWVTGEYSMLPAATNERSSREVNRGREPRVDSFVAEWEEFKTMFDRDMAELRIVCLQALGKEPQRSANDGHVDDSDED